MAAFRKNYEKRIDKLLCVLLQYKKVLLKKEQNMKVILKADVKGTGKKGDILEVSDGYARNFLLKKGLAEIATACGINEINQRRSADEYHRAEYVKSMKELAQKLGGAEVPVAIKVGENGKAFGSVTTAQIAQVLTEQGFEVDKKKITLKEPIKQLGSYDAEVRFMEGISAKIKIKVIPA